MKAIFVTRMFFWKKQWPNLLFWFAFPFVACLSIIHLTDRIQEDVQVPVGFVLEEETLKTDELLQKLEQSDLITPTLLTEEEAIHQLQIHELDSVFIIHEGYEEQIRKGNRNNLVTGIKSNMSFAYSSVKEMVISMVQEETVRSKAAYTVMGLNEQYSGSDSWSYDEIIDETYEVQQQENLITSNLLFNDSVEATEKPSFIEWNTWGLWAIFGLLSTLLLMDWIIKEKNSNTFIRFSFIKIPWHRYLLYTLILYFLAFSLTDLLAIFILDETFSVRILMVLLSFRLTALIMSFFLALLFNNRLVYYGVAFAITLFISVISGVIIPIDGLISNLHWLEGINPINAIQNNEVTISWLFITILGLLLWLIRKEYHYA
ncbi:ABC transporter permease [Ornithinibacillus halophilus]|uniref:ABC-2 type transport system permease protein n=1 Tax=Ornithinibacillus halophilus TaxID=930117 RepID=A0A1M5J1P9_9BACI|nr:ABC transporter permease [Ornithinibacillus halophilus]SHG34462.1 ABC-2 type transport system permease protein [Ornithinibacillus halophilus]